MNRFIILLCSCTIVLLPGALGFTSTPRVPSATSSRTASRQTIPSRNQKNNHDDSSTTTRLYNMYDDWASDLLSTSQSEYTYDELILPLDEECIEQCLEELMNSEYGKTMFGRHDMVGRTYDWAERSLLVIHFILSSVDNCSIIFYMLYPASSRHRWVLLVKLNLIRWMVLRLFCR